MNLLPQIKPVELVNTHVANNMLKAMETSEKDMFYIAVESSQRLNKQAESDSNYSFYFAF